MKTIINVLIGLALVGVVAAAILFVRTWGDEEKANKAPAPQATKVPRMSTGGVVASITQRLESTSGIPLKVRCPKRVDDVIGTTFRCSVRREGVDRRIAIAEVEINGPDGQFKWKSTPMPTDTAGSDAA